LREMIRVERSLVSDAWACAGVAVLAGMLVVVAGCGPSIKAVPVSGRVTLKGQPLGDVAINFSPVTGGDNAFAAYGKTDKDGRYTLKLVENGQAGATAGTNRVTLNESTGLAESDGGGPAVVLKLPPKARDGTMTIDVPATGTDAADFAF
jgi:hypothetical protein